MAETYDSAREIAAFASAVADDGREPTVVVAGCGGASTVAALREHGIDAYGFDLSRAALDDADPSLRDRLLEADLLEERLITRLSETFAIDEIDVFLTECMLSFLDADDAARALARIRDAPETRVLVHRVRLDPPVAAQEGEIDVTVMATSKWRAVCDPNDRDVWRDAFEPWELPVDDYRSVDEE